MSCSNVLILSCVRTEAPPEQPAEAVNTMFFFRENQKWVDGAYLNSTKQWEPFKGNMPSTAEQEKEKKSCCFKIEKLFGEQFLPTRKNVGVEN